MNTPRPHLHRALDGALAKVRQQMLEQQAVPDQIIARANNRQFIATHYPDVAEVLKFEPEFVERPNMMLHTSLCATIGFSASNVAMFILERALQQGTVTAIEWLNQVLTVKKATIRYVHLVWDVEVPEPFPVTPWIDIVPVSDLPPTPTKQGIERGYAHHFDPLFGIRRPTVAIVSRAVVSLLSDEGKTHKYSAQNIGLYQRMEADVADILLCITAAGPAAPDRALGWLEWDGVDLGPLSHEISFHSPEISRANSAIVLDPQKVIALATAYFGLPGALRGRIRRALDRLNRAIRRRDVADKAVEIATTLDLLLVDQGGEFRWKVSFRSALLASVELHERVRVKKIIEQVYDVRSKLVHSGKAGSQDDKNRVELAIPIVADVVKAIIFRGSIPNWTEFEFKQS